MDTEDPNWKIKKDMLCPECRVKAMETGGKSSKQATAAATITTTHEQGKVVDKSESHKEEGEGEEDHLSAELAHLELLLAEHELADYETALQDSLHQHTLQHEEDLEQAKSASLVDAPAPQQSLEDYMADVARAREESRWYWEEGLGMGVYRDHERAVQRARVQSYRELLEGYRRAKEGEVGVGDEDDEKKSRGGTSGSSSSMSTTKATAGSGGGGDERRWPVQDDVEDDDETIDRGPRDGPLSRRHFSSFRGDSRGEAAAGPAESFARRRTRSHASQGNRQRVGDVEAGDDQRPVAGGEDGGGGGEQRRRRSLLNMFRHGLKKRR